MDSDIPGSSAGCIEDIVKIDLGPERLACAFENTRPIALLLAAIMLVFLCGGILALTIGYLQGLLVILGWISSAI